MTYKLCQRCQFLVPDKKKLCPTCGCNKFSELRQNGKTVTAVPIESPGPAAQNQKPAVTPAITAPAQMAPVQITPRSTAPAPVESTFIPQNATTSFPEVQPQFSNRRPTPSSGSAALRQKFAMSDEDVAAARISEKLGLFKRVFGGERI